MQIVLVNLLFTLVFSLILTQHNNCAAQQRATVNVVVNSRQPLPAGELIYVEGNFSAFNPFYEDKIPLVAANDGSYIYSFIFVQGAQVTFQFTRGKADSHEVDANKQPVAPRQLVAQSSFQTQTFSIEKWNDLTAKPYQAPIAQASKENANQLEPRLRMHKALKGNSLSARDVYVWLPPNYNMETYRQYPVIYIHQNHAVFNPSGDFNNDWRIDETADAVANLSPSESYILVAIDNSNDPSFAANDWWVIEPYSQFVQQIVKPMIDSNYRTSRQADSQICMGSGIGGSISFSLAAKYPQQFGKAICISPIAYFPEYYKHLGAFVNKYSINKSKFIIELGENAKEARLKTDAKSLYDLLQKEGFDAVLETETNGDYTPINWESRISKLIGLLK